MQKGQKLFVYVTVKKKIQIPEDQIEKDENGEESPTDSLGGNALKIEDAAQKTKTVSVQPENKSDEKFVYHLVQPR